MLDFPASQRKAEFLLVHPIKLKPMQTTLEGQVIIDGVDEPNVHAYFTRLSHGEFGATAALFATQGYLQPPFEPMIQGREAIATYLEEETKGMKFRPESGRKLPNLSKYNQFKILGRVDTNLFTVNIRWLIQLNLAKEIVAVEVKLLNPLSNLLNLNHTF